jgi:hypothetical protein
MFEWTKNWVNLRRILKPLKQGKTIDLLYDKDFYIFARKNDSNFESVVIAINNSDSSKSFTLQGDDLEPPLVPIATSNRKLYVIEGSVIKENNKDKKTNSYKIMIAPKSVTAFVIKSVL